MHISTVTIVGANGTMGRNIAAIFASFGRAKVYMVSRTLEKSENAIEKAYKSVKADSIKSRMTPVDFEALEECVKESDLIFEACAEDLEIKNDVHKKIAFSLEKADSTNDNGKIICTGTSGLSVTNLAELYNEAYRKSFVGMHFFNPPYNMTLCELIATEYTDRELMKNIRNYLERILFRTTVEVKDKPAFLGNRIGFQFINSLVQQAWQYRYNGGIDYIDAIFGPFTGRTMAPLVTANFVGLDVHKAIVDNLYDNTDDYAHDTFILPEYVNKLVQEGKLGRKSGAGLYKTILHDNGRKIHQVYDIEHDNYRETINYKFPFVDEMTAALKTGSYDKAFAVLENNHSKEAELCCRLLLEYVLYALHATTLVGDDIHAADDVMAAGFNWCPPLSMIEAFSGRDHFEALCRERVDGDVLKQICFDEMISKIEKSKYDYRKFIKANR